MRSSAIGGMLCLLATAPAGPAHAEGCANATTQADMNICADRGFKASDAALNATYRQIIARLKDGSAEQHLLATAQMAWLHFRDAECAFSASGTAGGSAHAMILTQCEDALTQARVRALRAYLHCQEGDLSCPVPPE